MVTGSMHSVNHHVTQTNIENQLREHKSGEPRPSPTPQFIAHRCGNEQQHVFVIQNPEPKHNEISQSAVVIEQ
jgi:hypothetical protein